MAFGRTGVRDQGSLLELKFETLTTRFHHASQLSALHGIVLATGISHQPNTFTILSNGRIQRPASIAANGQ